MAEYLAPGVYVEETSFRSKSIEGVGTSTTAFAGPTRKGPVGGTPEILTSFGDFERIYGGFDDLGLSVTTNYMAHAVHAFFLNGGSLLYVSRAFLANAGDTGVASSADIAGGGADATKQMKVVARFPGFAGNGRVEVIQATTPATARTLAAAPQGTLLRLGGDAPAAPATNTFHVKQGTDFKDSGGTTLDLTTLQPGKADIITVNVVTTDKDGHTQSYSGLGLASTHPQFIGTILGVTQNRRSDDLETMFAFTVGSAVTPFGLYDAFFSGGTSLTISLAGGNDGGEPIQASYEDALADFEQLEDISIVACPGSSAYTDHGGIQDALIAHAERRRAYRIAVLDSEPGQAVSEVRTGRGQIDSTYAALYYPWVVVSNPLFRPGLDNIPREVTVPPSGSVCGIYARTDEERGVYKAPANEVVQGALRFETDINFAEQEVLNPLGVNCLRFFAGRGFRVWGARTASSDPEWKYVNVRRYFIYLEASIDRGTQWAVFEPNGEALWTNVRETIKNFLYNEWVSGALLGSTPEEAFFVRCDRSTMTQGDLDNGRLICLVGVAALKPAEFVIFRIGQKTADARS